MNIDFARQQMIAQQVRAWDVFDSNVLNGLSEVQRELFVPHGFEALAFADTEIPIGHDQKMMTPTIEGRVLQALELVGTESVLEIGTGSGFLSACLAKLSASVTSIDIYEDFLQTASDRLANCDIQNVTLQQMDATKELPVKKFDAIAVTGSLAPAMSALRITRTSESEWQSEALFETNLAPLVNGAQPPQFLF
jgi:protein-L-isoaspartate(D-aspartate) O-methyltransferase